MPKSQRLRVEDIQALWRLLGECRDMGADNQAWPQRFVEGMSRLLHSQIGICHETVLSNGVLKTLGCADTGWATATDREFLLRMIRNQGQRDPMFRKMVGVLLNKGTCRREEGVNDHEYYRSVLYQDYFRPPARPDRQLRQVDAAGHVSPGLLSAPRRRSPLW